ncbi:CPXCG motif-containing cysteine-rich protein [Vibrio lamellibrachiae]|uniref:CPXCG motif-containing cysteine-rich protein n=1 Tax=Vibrio lamellibrachiae TaxID=2910253 RepID=UPI003D0C7318
MLNTLTEHSISCPYCNETIDVLVDSSDLDQGYIEDCQVCCRPITFVITEGENEAFVVRVYCEDDVF